MQIFEKLNFTLDKYANFLLCLHQSIDKLLCLLYEQNERLNQETRLKF